MSLDLTNWTVSVEFWCLWCVNFFGQFLIDDGILRCQQCLTVAFTATMLQQDDDFNDQQRHGQHTEQNDENWNHVTVLGEQKLRLGVLIV